MCKAKLNLWLSTPKLTQELQFTQDYAKWVLEDQRWRESLLELESRKNSMETDVFSIMKYLIMQTKPVKPIIVRENKLKCPVESCRGYLQKDWKCPMCENQICSQCFKVKDVDHVCKESDKETFKAILSSSKLYLWSNPSKCDISHTTFGHIRQTCLSFHYIPDRV